MNIPLRINSESNKCINIDKDELTYKRLDKIEYLKEEIDGLIP